MKVLSVFYHGNTELGPVNVGRLSYAQGEGYFEYDANFLKLNLNLSPFYLKSHNLLQKAERHPFKGLHGVFNDSLPDCWGLYVMDKDLRNKGVDIDSLTSLDRLAYVGNRALGALSYQPDEGAQFYADDGSLINLNNLAKESVDLYTGEIEDVLSHLAINGTPSGGARPKAVLGLNGEDTISGAFDLPSGFEHWLAKFPTGTNAEKKAEGAVEFIYSNMARQAGIDFPVTKLILGEDENAYFMIKRFDREIGNKRIHMQTLAGLVHADFRLPDFTYARLLNVCFSVTKSHQEVM